MSDFFEGSGSLSKTDLFALNNAVQNTQIQYPKQLVIGVIRDIFSQDTTYHYVRDVWGFPHTPSVKGLAPDAGLRDDLTSRIWIGEAYRKDVIFYPAVVVRNGGSVYEPLSINRDQDSIIYSNTMVSDGYGNFRHYNVPVASVFAGIWNGTINIDIMSRGIRELDDIVEIISLTLVDWRFNELLRAGVLVKRLSVGSPSEIDDRADKLYKQTISIEIRTEWQRHIPIDNVVDMINICVEFGNFQSDDSFVATAPNLEIHTYVSLGELISGLFPDATPEYSMYDDGDLLVDDGVIMIDSPL